MPSPDYQCNNPNCTLTHDNEDRHIPDPANKTVFNAQTGVEHPWEPACIPMECTDEPPVAAPQSILAIPEGPGRWFSDAEIKAQETEIERLQNGIAEIIEARSRGDFSPMLPKLRALLEPVMLEG